MPLGQPGANYPVRVMRQTLHILYNKYIIYLHALFVRCTYLYMLNVYIYMHIVRVYINFHFQGIQKVSPLQPLHILEVGENSQSTLKIWKPRGVLMHSGAVTCHFMDPVTKMEGCSRNEMRCARKSKANSLCTLVRKAPPESRPIDCVSGFRANGSAKAYKSRKK